MNLKGTIEVVRQSLKKPLVTAIAGFVAGLIIGLPILGWGLFPVKWTDAAPEHLREDVKLDVMSMMVESYAYNQDSLLALNRWKGMGLEAENLFKKVQTNSSLKPADVLNFSTLVGVPFSGEVPVTQEVTKAPAQSQPGTEVTVIVSSDQTQPETQIEEVESTGKAKFKPLLLLGVLFLLLVLVGGALLYVLVLRKRTGGLLQTDEYVSQETPQSGEAVHALETDHETPIARFMTTYAIGDDLYDDSFSIDSPSGEFLGECGVGISETIGVGEPKKVAALEIWLFDKNDIQTVTKVLMSDYSFNDPVVSQRVVSKGEPVLLEPDKVVLLETATLQLEARVVDLTYGQSALPESSYFDRITIDLSIWPKA